MTRHTKYITASCLSAERQSADLDTMRHNTPHTSSAGATSPTAQMETRTYENTTTTDTDANFMFITEYTFREIFVQRGFTRQPIKNARHTDSKVD